MERLEQIKSEKKSVLHSKGSNAMKRNLFLVIKTVLLLMLFSNNAFSQGAPTTQGKEFWVSFGFSTYPPATNFVAYQIRIVATKTTDVTLFFTSNSSSRTFTVDAGQTYTYTFTTAEKVAATNTATGKTIRSLHITSDEDVSVYAVNTTSNYPDATNVLPVNNYGTSYFALSYRSRMVQMGDSYLAIATEDNTEISVNGSVVETLNRGEVYTYAAGANNVDLTGRNITSNRPFAFFTIAEAVTIPLGKEGGDYIFQQLTPVHSWGNTFFVPVTNATRNGITRDKDRIRILASQDGTMITQTGGTIVNLNLEYGSGNVPPNNKTTLSSPLNAGEFVELQIDLADGGCHIISDKPVAVVSYLIGTHYFLPVIAIPGTQLGDPSMTWIPPLEQTVTSASIAPFFITGPASNLFDDQHYALIVTPTVSKNNTRVSVGSGAPQSLSGGTWTDNAASGYSFYTYNFSATNKDDAYYFTNPAGFTIMGYGLGLYEAYYYLAASSSRNLEASFYVNEIHNQDVDGQSFCGDQFNIRAEVQFPLSSNVGRLRWLVDGTEILSARDQLQFNTQLAIGTHTIKMVALSIGNETFEIETTVTVLPRTSSSMIKLQ